MQAGRKGSSLNRVWWIKSGILLCSIPQIDAVPDTDLFICLLTIELVIPWARSLKDKRSAVRGLKDRLRSRFNASVVEVDYQDKWQRAVIAICILSGDRRRLEADMSRVRQLCEQAQDLQVSAMHQQWL